MRYKTGEFVLVSSCLLMPFFMAFSWKNGSPANGQQVYERYCVACHGRDGTRGILGAKNLQKSILSDSDYYTTIYNGRNRMPSWKKKLSPEEIEEVISYLKLLKRY